MAKKQKKGAAMAQSLPFFSLLPASKQRRIEQYKDLPRVKSWLEEGKEVVALLMLGSWIKEGKVKVNETRLDRILNQILILKVWND